MGDGGGHEIAYLRHRLAFGHTDIVTSQSPVFSRPVTRWVAASFLPDAPVTITSTVHGLSKVLRFFFGDAFLQCHESFEPVLDHVVRHLLHFGCRSAWARRIDEGECGRESRLFHHTQGFLEVLFGFTREPTMMSVEICASGMASRILRRMSRNFAERYERRMARRIRSDPDCSGKCSWCMTLGVSAMAAITSR